MPIRLTPTDTSAMLGALMEMHMTREQALEIARNNQMARSAAWIAHDFKGGPAVNEADFGYRHGWYSVGEFSFSNSEVTGVSYDPDQGGWAYL